MKLQLALVASLLTTLAVSTAGANPPSDTRVIDPWGRSAPRSSKPETRPKTSWIRPDETKRKARATIQNPWRKSPATRGQPARRLHRPSAAGRHQRLDPWRVQRQRPVRRGQVVQPWRRVTRRPTTTGGAGRSPAARRRGQIRRPWHGVTWRGSAGQPSGQSSTRRSKKGPRPRLSAPARRGTIQRDRARLQPPASSGAEPQPKPRWSWQPRK